MDSLRQQIFAAVVQRFQGITTAGGYQTNAGANVSSWRSRPFEAHEMPGISVADTREEPKIENLAPNGGTWSRTLTVEVGFAAGSASAPGIDATGRRIIADLETAIAVDPTFGGLAEWSLPGTNEMGVEREEDAIVAGKYTFTIIYRSQSWDSYNG